MVGNVEEENGAYQIRLRLLLIGFQSMGGPLASLDTWRITTLVAIRVSEPKLDLH